MKGRLGGEYGLGGGRIVCEVMERGVGIWSEVAMCAQDV